jgi:flagellar motor switch/type III secretory pathway protein FliN
MKLSPEIADKLLDACRAGASEAAAAFSAAFDAAWQIVNVETRPLPPGALADELRGPGLAIVFHAGEQAALLLVPEGSQLLPSWCAAPDAAGQAKLQTLAQSLSRLLLPAEVVCTKSSAGVVADMALALARGRLSDGGRLTLTAKSRDRETPLHLVWPLQQGERLLEERTDEGAAAATPLPHSPAETATLLEEGLSQLPGYSRSLLCINVPVVVTLAQTRRKVSEVIKLGPGAIIQFDKPCEDTLELEAGGQKIAEGEAVKVGEKFGLRITAIRLPEERFTRVGT